MAKKSKKETIVDNAELDALVNEGKDLDVVKASEVIADNTEEKEDVEVEDLIQEANDAQVDEIIKSVMEEAVEDEADYTDATDEEIPTEYSTHVEREDESLEFESKDVEEEQNKKVKKHSEPWYIARAKREADYYNW